MLVAQGLSGSFARWRRGKKHEEGAPVEKDDYVTPSNS
jgi:hypothetical protein